MIYSSIPFFFYLLFTIVVFAFLPKKFLVHWLILASIVWIASWKVEWVCFYLFVAILNFFLIKLSFNAKSIHRNNFLQAILCLDVVIFCFSKSGGLGSWQFQSPYGLSFFMFMIFALIIDFMRSDEEIVSCHFSDFILLPLFFPLLMGGPIVRGKQFFEQLKNKLYFNYQNTSEGLLIFGLGFCKMFFLSKSLAVLNTNLYHVVLNGKWSALFLLGISGTIQAYVDFSSYCDMGRGAGRCFGFQFENNFKPIYFSKNPNDYWQRWNISLGTWIRDYISFPMMLRWGRTINQNIILLFSFILVGLWHGLNLNWLVFGVYNGLIIISFNWVNKKIRLPSLGYIFALLIFLGNGLLQRVDLFHHLREKAFPVWSDLYDPYFWIFRPGEMALAKSNLASSLWWGLITLFVYDFIQEKMKKSDWFIPKALLWRNVCLVFFLAWLYFALCANWFQGEVVLPPVYFRI